MIAGTLALQHWLHYEWTNFCEARRFYPAAKSTLGTNASLGVPRDGIRAADVPVALRF